ncbi:MAG: Xaa-Pro peptidase family protein [Trebonia sp.]
MEASAIAQFVAEVTEQSKAVPPSIPFSREEYAGRLAKLRAAMAADGLDTLLLSSPEAMCWLHGLTLRWYKAQSPREWRPLTCTAVNVNSDTFIQFEGVEHAEMLRRTSVAEDIRLLPRYQRSDMLGFIVGELAAEGWLAGTVGVEEYAHVPNVAVGRLLRTAMEAAGATVVDGTDAARRVRRRKSPAEIAYIEKAAEICDIGILHLAEVLRPGMTELDAWSAMTGAMARAGGEHAGIHEMVTVGTVGVGHSIAGRRVLSKGDFVEVDPCGVYNRYHANRNMTFYLGEPPESAVAMMEILAGAYDVIREVAKVGTPVKDLNRALKEYYTDRGVWHLNSQYWVGGYELGIAFPPDWVGEWHFTVNSDDEPGLIEEGMVTNYESIVGIGLLDTIVYESSGPRTLSTIPHKIIAVSC